MDYPLFKSITLRGFRSIRSDHIRITNPLFLVGRNGAGKSNVADAFAFLADAVTLPLQAVFNVRGGLSNVRNRTEEPPRNVLGMGVELENLPIDFPHQGGNWGTGSSKYAFEIRPAPRYGFEVVREQCLVERVGGGRTWFDRRTEKFETNVEPLKGLQQGAWLGPESLGLPLVSGIFPFMLVQTLRRMRVYSIEPAKLREMQDPDTGQSLRSDGSNATSVLNEIRRTNPDSLERILQILSGIVPYTKQIRTRKHGKKLSLEFLQEWGKNKRLQLEAFGMSDGTLRALGLLLAVYQTPSPSLIVIEEPEASIHPGAIPAILDLIRYASKQMQVVITTHSPEVLDAEWIKDENLRLVTWQDGATRVAELGDMSKTALQQHLMGAGELFRSNALIPAPLLDDLALAPSLFEELA